MLEIETGSIVSETTFLHGLLLLSHKKIVTVAIDFPSGLRSLMPGCIICPISYVVLCVACLTVFVNCLVKQIAMCLGVVAILLLNV